MGEQQIENLLTGLLKIKCNAAGILLFIKDSHFDYLKRCFSIIHYFIRFFLESIRRQDKLKMNQFYFGTMDQFIQAAYAPTGRAACRSCKQKIQKQQLKLGVCMQSDHFNGQYWYHLPCFTLRPLFKDINPEEQIYNLDQLDEEDYNKVLDHVNNQLQRLKEGKKAKSRTQTKMAKSKRKKAKSQQSQDEQPKVEKQSLKTRRAKSNPKNKSKSKQRQVVKPPKKQAKKKIKKVAKKQEGYTEDQKEKFKQLRNKYMSYGAEKLKQILSLNGQPKTGNKGDLIEKCADGELLGRIPLCSSCGGGKLRFDGKTGIYKCPGFMDDDQFKNCNQLFTISQIVREPWKLP